MPPPAELVLLGLQHVVTMFPATVLSKHTNFIDRGPNACTRLTAATALLPVGSIGSMMTRSRSPRSPGRRMMDAWSLRHSVSAYDALYVAAARAVEAALVTADGPLSNASNLGITVYNARNL